jgi:hypothetical protein
MAYESSCCVVQKEIFEFNNIPQKIILRFMRDDHGKKIKIKK